MLRPTALACLAAIACGGCDRVFGVEGTSFPIDASLPLEVISFLDGSSGAYSAAVLADHPLAYYLLDETSGPTAADVAGRVDGTYVGDILYAESPAVLSEPGTSPLFDQNDVDNSGVLFGNNFSFAGLAPFTLELWIFPTVDNTHTFRNVISKWLEPSPTSAGYIIYTQDANTLVFARDDIAGKRGQTSAPINTGGWSHVVGSYDGTNLTLSVNGNVAGTSVSPELLPPMTTNFVVGSANGNVTTNPFRGQIDDVAIYDYALTPEQAYAHYQAAGVAD
ncbi:MAG TPA: LamG domain-containing protein [Kofleriaceae bacterium]|jgi:hypothetical protein